jgi:hypothetical protein
MLSQTRRTSIDSVYGRLLCCVPGRVCVDRAARCDTAGAKARRIPRAAVNSPNSGRQENDGFFLKNWDFPNPTLRAGVCGCRGSSLNQLTYGQFPQENDGCKCVFVRSVDMEVRYICLAQTYVKHALMARRRHVHACGHSVNSFASSIRWIAPHLITEFFDRLLLIIWGGRIIFFTFFPRFVLCVICLNG